MANTLGKLIYTIFCQHSYKFALRMQICKNAVNRAIRSFNTLMLGELRMINRDSAAYITFIAPKMPVLCILGPRQSGKTTLARHSFPHYLYFSCEDRGTAAIIEQDPAAFLNNHLSAAPGIIIDEFQRCPDILSAIQVYVDETNRKGSIILTGSQNYLMMAGISQSLAGRIVLITLLPLSINELQQAHQLPQNINDLIFRGGYPRLYADASLPSNEVYEGYINTYLERDIRTLQQVQNLSLFHTFIQLCANRIGQLLNFSSLANESGISVNTAKQWISLLETSYLVYLLQPHHANFNKRLTKSPKLYFYDTGIASQLLNIASPHALFQHSMRGALFENLVVSECIKWYRSHNLRPHLYFWRDHTGHEIDLIIDHAEKLFPLEIKSAGIARNTMTDGLAFWHKLTGHPLEESYVIYTGMESHRSTGSQFVPWQQLHELLNRIHQVEHAG